MDRESVAQMAAEFLREAAVLVFVFSLVEKLLEGRSGLSGALPAFVLTVLFLVGGMVLERTRKE